MDLCNPETWSLTENKINVQPSFLFIFHAHCKYYQHEYKKYNLLIILTMEQVMWCRAPPF